MTNTINIYEPITMLRAVETMYPAKSFFLDTFFPTTENQLTETVLVDVKKGKRRMSPFVAPRVGGVTVERDGFRTDTIKTPKIAPQRKLTTDDLAQRLIGESIISTTKAADRAQTLLATDLIELKDMNLRRKEWMARQILTTGKFSIEGKADDDTTKVELEIDFGFTNTTTLTSTAKWDASSTADPIKDLRAERLKIIKATGKAPTIVVMSSDVAALFVANPKVVALTDKQKIKTIDINPTIMNDAVTFVGKILELGLEIYSYDEWFLDDAGAEQPMMPTKTLIIGSRALGRVIHGSITMMNDAEQFETYQGADIPKVWADKDNDIKMVRLSSRPVPAPFDVDAWSVIVTY